MQSYKIYEEISKVRDDYENGDIDIVEGLPFSQYRTLKMAEFYSNSKYLGGNKDHLGDKPFFNIVNFRVTLAKTATDLDIKDVSLTSDNPNDRVRSMLMSKELYQWMKAENFGYTLNKFGYYRPKYGGAIVKTEIEKEKGEKESLCIDVVEWKNVITDQVDIEHGPKIEIHFMTPVELAEYSGVWDNVEELLKETKKGNKKKKNVMGDSEYSSSRLTIFEVHGVFSDATLKDAKGLEASEKDEYTYSQQKYVLWGDEKKQIVLYAEKEATDPYDYLPWEEMSGRGLGKGVIEDSEEAQVWTNDSVVKEKRAMDLAGKVLAKTTAQGLGNNILNIDNGRMFELQAGEDVTMLNLTPTSLGEYEVQRKKWDEQASRATSSFDAATGEQPPANTPYLQTAFLNSVATKPFDFRKEEAGIFWSGILMKRVMPFLIKKITKSHILASDFSPEELEIIDNSFATFSANQKLKERIIAGKPLAEGEYEALVDAYKSGFGKTTRRFIEIPDGYFDDYEAKITISMTNEARDKAATLQSLSTIMRDIASSFNPQTGTYTLLENPITAKIFGNIIELAGSGLSPVNLGIGGKGSSQAAPPMPAVPAPEVAPQTTPVV